MSDSPTFVWIVYSYWGPGSIDPFFLIESVWTTEAAARSHAGNRHDVMRMPLNVPEGYDYDEVAEGSRVGRSPSASDKSRTPGI